MDLHLTSSHCTRASALKGLKQISIEQGFQEKVCDLGKMTVICIIINLISNSYSDKMKNDHFFLLTIGHSQRLTSLISMYK